MGRSHVCGSVGLVAGVLLFLSCGDGKSPAQPTPSLPAPTQPVFSLSGRVTDTAYRPLSGARVEVIDGLRAGTVATTDEAGRFSMPEPFTGAITVIASKDGHRPDSRTVPLGRLPPGESGGRWELAFYLEPLGPSANAAGVYTLRLTADSACTNLPADARTRTYTATIVPGGGSSHFLANLSDARFLSKVPCPPGQPPETCTYNHLGIGIAGDYAGITAGFVEQLGETTYLVVTAGAEGSFGPIGITAPLGGQFLYCPSEPVLIDQGTWACPANDDVQCDSYNHQLTLVRR